MAFLVVGILSGITGCGKAEPRLVTFSGETQGTTFSIKVVGKDTSDERTAALQTAIEARLDRVDRAMSTYRPDSELSRFNASASTEPTKVDPDLVTVLQMAHEVSEASDGAFDVTVGPLVQAWGFGPGHETRPEPTETEIAVLRERIGYHHLETDLTQGTIRKRRPDLVCDVNAIAQGFTVDKLCEDIEALGWLDYMVEVGGEVRARGNNADGVPWRIGIERPISGSRELAHIVALSGLGLATSGDYRQYREQNGMRISHTIDPRAGRPIAHTLASVSVLHQSCAMADAYATALMVLGPDAAQAVASKQGLAAMFVAHMATGEFLETMTPAFRRAVVE